MIHCVHTRVHIHTHVEIHNIFIHTPVRIPIHAYARMDMDDDAQVFVDGVSSVLAQHFGYFTYTYINVKNNVQRFINGNITVLDQITTLLLKKRNHHNHACLAFRHQIYGQGCSN